MARLVSASAAGAIVYSIAKVFNLRGKSFAICVDNLVKFEEATVLVKFPLFHLLTAAQSSKAAPPETLGDYQIVRLPMRITIRADIIQLFTRLGVC